MTEPARAKINLCLHVTGRRLDGYHLLDSLVAFAEAADTLTLKSPEGPLSLELEGPFAAGLAAEADNLVLRAARQLAAAAGRPASGQFVLYKALPLASGIGGGSADAAAALRLLLRAWRLDPAEVGLPALALALGADVPVCLAGRAARMGGIGEALAPAPALPECGIALVNPGVQVATQAVFRARAGAFSAPAMLSPGWRDSAELIADLARGGNDLEAPAIALCPAIAAVLSALRAIPDCRLARMSGSGATCFGLFETAEAARAAAAVMVRPGWWTHGGRLLG